MSSSRFLPQWLRAACKPFVLALVCSAVLGLVLGNVTANAVCYTACTVCDCFRGYSTGTHYKITACESGAVYKDMYWTAGWGNMQGYQLVMFKECPSTEICVGGPTIEKLQCGPTVEGIAMPAGGGRYCSAY